MKVLVTGGGGFLGGAIVDQLLARGEAVRSFSRGQYPELAAKGVETVQGDLADPEAVRKAVAGCEVVFHTAAKPGMWGSYESYYRPNVLGTRNVIAACKTEGVPRLVHTSSPSVAHGAGSIEGADESIGIPNSFDAHYPATKAEAGVAAGDAEPAVPEGVREVAGVFPPPAPGAVRADEVGVAEGTGRRRAVGLSA